MRGRHIWIILALAGTPICTPAQWLNQPPPGTPKGKDGKPNLAAHTPRTRDGHPDLSGVWQSQSATNEELLRLIPGGGNGLGEDPPSKYFLNILSDFKPEDAPLVPSAAAAYRLRSESFSTESPLSHCQPAGVPMAETAPGPFKIVQTPGLIVMLYERDTTFRQIHTDGRKHPDDPQPAWFGYSVGQWEGDTLVVDTAGFNDRGWLDARGHTHSDALRLTERFHRRDFGHMEVQITVDDPKTYTRPFTIRLNQVLLPASDLIEYFCSENERDLRHFTGK
jgi:hypothetical protein